MTDTRTGRTKSWLAKKNNPRSALQEARQRAEAMEFVERMAEQAEKEAA